MTPCMHVATCDHGLTRRNREVYATRDGLWTFIPAYGKLPEQLACVCPSIHDIRNLVRNANRGLRVGVPIINLDTCRVIAQISQSISTIDVCLLRLV